MKTALYEMLASSPTVGRYLASFRLATHLPISLVPNRDGSEVARRAPKTPICALVAATAAGAEACQYYQANFRRRVETELSPQQACCFAGVVELAVPVMVGGEHVATLVAGQVLPKKPTAQDFNRVVEALGARGIRIDRRRLRRAYFNTPVVSEEQLQAIINLLSVFAQHMADFAHRWMLAGRNGEAPRIAMAKEYVAAHLGERVTTREVAHHLQLNTQYFCRLFKDVQGMTLGEYVATARIEKAKSMLFDPDTRIIEIAEACGFGSPSHFNRAFRRHVGMTPTEYRAAQSRAYTVRASGDVLSQPKRPRKVFLPKSQLGEEKSLPAETSSWRFS